MSCILSRGNYILSCGGLRLTTVSDLVLPTSQFFIFLFSFLRNCYPTKISANHKIEKKKKKKNLILKNSLRSVGVGREF